MVTFDTRYLLAHKNQHSFTLNVKRLQTVMTFYIKYKIQTTNIFEAGVEIRIKRKLWEAKLMSSCHRHSHNAFTICCKQMQFCINRQVDLPMRDEMYIWNMQLNQTPVPPRTKYHRISPLIHVRQREVFDPHIM